MRRSSGINVSSSIRGANEGQSRSPSRASGETRTPVRGGMSQRERFLSPGSTREGAQDAAILQSAFSDDVKIRQGKTLLKPSEIRNRTPGKKRIKDWGECPLTFDSIKEPVRAGDGNVYERWAIKKWLEENGNRSPLTNVIISPELTPLMDTEEGIVKGSRYISPDKTKEYIKTEINTVLNTVRDAPGLEIDESKYVRDIPPVSYTSTNNQVSAANDDDGGGADAAGDKNKMIAAIMRDTSLTPAERNAKIQALRTGNSFAPPPPQVKPPLPPPSAMSPAGLVDGPALAKSLNDLLASEAGPAAPASLARTAAAGAVKRAQAGLAVSGPEPDTKDDSQSDREDSRFMDALLEEDMRLTQLKSRGYSGFDPNLLSENTAGSAGMNKAQGARPHQPREYTEAREGSSAGEGGEATSAARETAAAREARQPTAAREAKGGTGGGGGVGGMLGRMLGSNKADETAKKLLGRPDVFGDATCDDSTSPTQSTLPESRTTSAALAPPKPSEYANGVSLTGRAESAVGPSIKTMTRTSSGSRDAEAREARAPHAHAEPTAPAQGGVVEGGVRVGVGITFGQFHKDHMHSGALYVKQLQDQGSAKESGIVFKGDILFEVDGLGCYRSSIDRIQAKILGPVGSSVALVLKRPAVPASSSRTSATEPIDSMPTVAITLQRREPPIGHQLGVVEEPRAHAHQSHGEPHTAHREAHTSRSHGEPHTAHRETHTTSRSADILQSQSDAAVANRARPLAPDHSDGKSSRMGAAAGVGAGGAVLRGVLAGRKLHEDLMQVLEIQAEKSPVALFGKDCWSMEDMRKKGELLDVSLCSNDATLVRAHGLLLAASSPLLRSLVSQRNTKGATDVTVHVTPAGDTQVTLSDESCSGAAIEGLVRFIYAGNLRVHGALDLVQLFRVSRFLQVASLEEAAEDGLLAMLTVNTCAHLLAIAHSEGCGRLLDGCHVFALQNFEAVSSTSAFVDVDEALVEAMVRSESLVAKDEEAVLEALLSWMSVGSHAPLSLRGEKLARHIRFGTIQAQRLEELLSRPHIKRSSKVRSYIEQGLAVQQSGARGQTRPFMGKSLPTSVSPSAPFSRTAASSQANLLGVGGGDLRRFLFDSSRSHPNHQILDAGMLAVLREDGDSEHSAILLPAVSRTGRSYVEFLIENTGTPDCYIQLGVCTGQHDVRGGTPAYQSDSGWCFSCHNGNLLHFDQGSEYSSKFPRNKDRVGLLVDMRTRTLEVFVNGFGQGVMVRALPETLYYVIDAGDKGQAIRVLPNAAMPP